MFEQILVISVYFVGFKQGGWYPRMLEIWKASKKQAKAKGSMRGTISETESIVPPKEDEDECLDCVFGRLCLVVAGLI